MSKFIVLNVIVLLMGSISWAQACADIFPEVGSYSFSREGISIRKYEHILPEGMTVVRDANFQLNKDGEITNLAGHRIKIQSDVEPTIAKGAFLGAPAGYYWLPRFKSLETNTWLLTLERSEKVYYDKPAKRIPMHDAVTNKKEDREFFRNGKDNLGLDATAKLGVQSIKSEFFPKIHVPNINRPNGFHRFAKDLLEHAIMVQNSKGMILILYPEAGGKYVASIGRQASDGKWNEILEVEAHFFGEVIDSNPIYKKIDPEAKRFFEKFNIETFEVDAAVAGGRGVQAWSFSERPGMLTIAMPIKGFSVKQIIETFAQH